MPRKVPPTKAALGLFTPGYRTKWSDPEWTNGLSRTAKGLYQQIIEQPAISRVGVVTRDPQALADQHYDARVEEIEEDLRELEDKRYILTYGPHMFVRRWFRYNRSSRNVNHLGPMLREIDGIGRKELRIVVVQALLEDLCESARQGEPLAPAIIDLLTEFTSRWEVPMPDAILKARKPPRATRLRAVGGSR